VDKSAASCRVIAGIVESTGIRAELATEAAQARRMLAAAARDNTPFRLIVIDSQMPDLDVFDLAAAEMKPGAIPRPAIVMLTRPGRHSDSARCGELGIVAGVSKPVAQTQLLDAIRLALTGVSSPPSAPPVYTPRISGRSETSAGSPLRILLAEDNMVNQMVAAGILQKRGHSVKIAANGAAAVAALESDEFDLVLMDLQMPQMDGFEAARAIRRKECECGGHIPIIALTAHAMVGDRERCLASGMDGYSAKPIRADDLFREMERVLVPGLTAVAKAATNGSAGQQRTYAVPVN
jgi:CheY-like chemotaxis protein